MPKETIVDVNEDNAAEVAQKEFLAEKAAKEGKELPKDEPKKGEEEPTAKTDEELLSAKDEDLSTEEVSRKGILVKEKEEKSEAKTDEELLDSKDEDLDDKQKARKDTLLKALIKKDEETKKEDDRILALPDEQLNETELARKNELLAARGKDTLDQEKASKEFDKEVKAYAKENKISEDEARSRLTDDKGSIDKIQEKYGKDPAKLAKANLYIQRLYTKAQEDLKILQQQSSAPKLSIESVIEAIEGGEFTQDGKKVNTQEVIDTYRGKYPKLTENIDDDDVVLQMAAKEIKEYLETKQKASLAGLEKQAQTKKDKLIEGMSEEDKKFLPVIKPLLDKTPTMQVMEETFDLEDLVLWAKGQSYDKDVAEAREDGFKRGRSSIRIKTGPIGKGGPGEGKSGPKALTDEQKDEALEMFPSAATADEAYKLYAELKKDEQEIRDKNKDKNKGKE